MRVLRFAVVSALLLACSDSTGISLQGPSFVRVRLDGHPIFWGEQDSFLWVVNGPTLVVQAVPGTLLPANNRMIGFQIGDYRGPGTYALEENTTPGPVSDAFYEVWAGQPLVPTQSFQTMGPYTGTVRIIAVDTTRGTLVGTFEFSAAATLGTGVVHITEGSFRIHQ
jgi:uncharacterized protein DUF6252